MNPETEQFLAEGMGRYKQAAFVMMTFGKEIESRLQAILKDRKDWGPLTPAKEARAKSTTYWSQYPLLNARLPGKLNGENALLTIAINWYESETEYPFYSVGMDPSPEFLSEADLSTWGERFELRGDWLSFYPDPDDFDLERDFNRLLDLYVEIIGSSV